MVAPDGWSGSTSRRSRFIAAREEIKVRQASSMESAFRGKGSVICETAD